MRDWKPFLPYLWRAVLTAVGLVVALLFLFIGFWRTLVILICCGVGFAAGFCVDKKIMPRLPESIKFWKHIGKNI